MTLNKGNLPVTQGVRDVARDYLQKWSTVKADLQKIKTQDVAAVNALIKTTGLPELYMP